MINLLYLVHTLIYNMDIYKTPSLKKQCFHIIFIIIVNYYSLKSYFSYVTVLHVVARIDCCYSKQCFPDFSVHYYSAIRFHIGEVALECHLPINFSENKNCKQQENQKTSIAVLVRTFRKVYSLHKRYTQSYDSLFH